MNVPVLTAVAWPYANGPRHIGHVSGFGVPSDVFSRYRRMAGDAVLMVSGTDEHGTPIQVQADAEGLTPRELADKYNRVIVNDLQGLGLGYDLFTRTTTGNHYAVAQELFKTVYDVTLAGDDEPIPIAQRPDYRRIYEAATPREALTIAATFERILFVRVGPLVALATAQAAAGDKDLRAFVKTIETERATGNRGLVVQFASRFGLRPDLTVDRATEILWTLTGPHPAEQLVIRCGWDWPTYEAWLVDTVHHALFGSP